MVVRNEKPYKQILHSVQETLRPAYPMSAYALTGPQNHPSDEDLSLGTPMDGRVLRMTIHPMYDG
jgi:hypothetical protein